MKKKLLALFPLMLLSASLAAFLIPPGSVQAQEDTPTASNTPVYTVTITAPPPPLVTVLPGTFPASFLCPTGNPLLWNTVTPSSAWWFFCAQCISTRYATSTPRTPTPTITPTGTVSTPTKTPTPTLTPTATPSILTLYVMYPPVLNVYGSGMTVDSHSESCYQVYGGYYCSGTFTAHWSTNAFERNMSLWMGMRRSDNSTDNYAVYMWHRIVPNYVSAVAEWGARTHDVSDGNENWISWTDDASDEDNVNRNGDPLPSCGGAGQTICKEVRPFYIRPRNSSSAGQTFNWQTYFYAVPLPPTTPTVTPTATATRIGSYCDVTDSVGSIAFSYSGLIFGAAHCVDVGNWSVSILGIAITIPWIAHLCFQDVTLGTVILFNVVVSLDVIAYVLGVAWAIRNLFIS